MTQNKKTTAKESNLGEPEKVETGNQATTVAPAPEDTGVKQVNIGLSESNKMQPEAGIQAIAPTDATESVIKTDPYNPQKTSEQAELKEDIDESETKVSKASYDALKNAFTAILDNQNLDVVQKMHYKNLAGL